MTNYIEKLKELRDKATPGPWFNYGDGILRSGWEAGGPGEKEGVALIVAMRNSLDLWLELAEAAHHLERLVASNLLTNKHPKYRVQRVLAKLRGEHE